MKTMRLTRTLFGSSLAVFFLINFASGSFAQSNMPPQVHITAPMNGSVFPVPANIHVCAEAFDRDGHVVSVEFFAGTNSLGMITNFMNAFLCVTWSNAPAGTHVLTAKA